MRKHGLTEKPSKCTRGRSYVEYLGHVVGSGTVAVPRMRMTAMAEFKQPVTRKNTRAFIGSIGYYRKFIPNFAKYSSVYSSVLTPATCQDAPGRVVWTLKMLESLRSVLCRVCVLNVPVLQTDASAGGVGAVLNVVRGEQTLSVAFFSKQLQGAEHRYSATELEALAVYRAILIFFMAGNLLYLRITRHLYPCEQGWALKLQDYTFTIIYRRGVTNGNADGLSRQAIDGRR